MGANSHFKLAPLKKGILSGGVHGQVVMIYNACTTSSMLPHTIHKIPIIQHRLQNIHSHQPQIILVTGDHISLFGEIGAREIDVIASELYKSVARYIGMRKWWRALNDRFSRARESELRGRGPVSKFEICKQGDAGASPGFSLVPMEGHSRMCIINMCVPDKGHRGFANPGESDLPQSSESSSMLSSKNHTWYGA